MLEKESDLVLEKVSAQVLERASDSVLEKASDSVLEKASDSVLGMVLEMAWLAEGLCLDWETAAVLVCQCLAWETAAGQASTSQQSPVWPGPSM